MSRPFEFSPVATGLAFALSLAALFADPPAAADDSVSIDDIRFASSMGTPPLSSANPTEVSESQAPVDFRGRSGQSCATLDLNAFLNQFNPRELIAELHESLLSGAQSLVSNYLLALAYSAPTLASVLDITDRQLHARFTAFAHNCANQQVRAISLQNAERRLAQASDQCFERETARGTAPTDAYRTCSVSRRYDALALPAALTTLDFLRRHSDLLLTPRIESLLALLPDERIVAGNYQIRPPRTSLGGLSEALRTRSRLALDQLINGAPLTSVAECTPDSLPNTGASACLPRSAVDVVTSPAFHGARLLGPAALSMFKDALSSQLAVTAVYSDLLELERQIARMNLRNDSDANTSEILSRQRSLQDQVTRLLAQADLQVKLQESKLRLARTQLVALERSRADLETKAAALQAQPDHFVFSLGSMLQLLQDRN
jgi:AraC-like DNA-binding protein